MFTAHVVRRVKVDSTSWEALTVARRLRAMVRVLAIIMEDGSIDG